MDRLQYWSVVIATWLNINQQMKGAFSVAKRKIRLQDISSSRVQIIRISAQPRTSYELFDSVVLVNRAALAKFFFFFFLPSFGFLEEQFVTLEPQRLCFTDVRRARVRKLTSDTRIMFGQQTVSSTRRGNVGCISEPTSGSQSHECVCFYCMAGNILFSERRSVMLTLRGLHTLAKRACWFISAA